jgi:hypothetical protein
MAVQNVATVDAIKEYVRKNATPLWQDDLPYPQFSIVFAADGNVYSCIQGNNLVAPYDNPVDPTLEINQGVYWDLASGGGGGSTLIEGLVGGTLNITNHEAIAIGSDGKFWSAQNNDETLSRVVGLAVNITGTAAPGDLIEVQKIGLLEEVYTRRGDILAGEELYLGKNGEALRPSDSLNFGEYRVLLGIMNENDLLDVIITEPIQNDLNDASANMPIGAQMNMSIEGYVPDTFLLADGSAISRSVYGQLDSLYAADGYPYGDGDGSTTFNLPNWTGTNSLPVVIKARNGGPLDPLESAQLERRIVALENSGNKDVGEVFYTLEMTELPGCRFLDYQRLNKVIYAELFSKIGHAYAKTAADATSADLAGEFHIPDGQFLFARAGQSWPITDASINVSTDRITLTAHGLATDGTQDGRPIKLMRVPGQTPTMPVGSDYTEYDQNYIRVIDANTIELYASEAEAINTAATTGRVNFSSAGTGTFKLTTNGCYQSDAFQGHWHNANAGLTSTGNGKATGSTQNAIVDSIVGDPITDTINGTPRTTNETRPSYVSLNMQIKVIGTSYSTGATFDSMAYTSGWKYRDTWFNTSFNEIHGLDSNMSDLVFKISFSPDGTEANAVEIGQFSSEDVGAFGYSFAQVSKDEVKIITGTQGIRFQDAVGTDVLISNASPYYYKLVIFKANFFNTSTKLVDLTNIAVDTSIEINADDYGTLYSVSDAIAADLTLTVTKGAGVTEANYIRIRNKSNDYKVIVSGDTTYWLTKQTTDFRFDGTTLVWASGGWETLYLDESSVSTVVEEGSLLRAVENNKKYKFRYFEPGQSTDWAYEFWVVDKTRKSKNAQNSAVAYPQWDGPNIRFDTAYSGFVAREVQIWHDPA